MNALNIALQQNQTQNPSKNQTLETQLSLPFE